jgi:hypothetical protein
MRPWKKSLGLLLLGLAIAAPADAAPAAGNDKEKGADTWYAETVQHGDAGLRVMNIWSKGRKLRAETVVGGTVLLTLVNGDIYYNIIPSAGIGVAILRSPKAIAGDQKGGRPFGRDVEKILARGAEKAGSERLMGREVTIYRLNAGNTREEVWATEDAEKLPIKLVYTDREKGQSAETMLNWSRGMPLADAFFEPDPRIALEKMSYEEFLARVKDGKLASFPPLFSDLLSGSPQ